MAKTKNETLTLEIDPSEVIPLIEAIERKIAEMPDGTNDEFHAKHCMELTLNLLRDYAKFAE